VSTSHPSDPREGDAPPPRDVCMATLDGSPERTCCRPRGHEGLHRWRAPSGVEQFEWG